MGQAKFKAKIKQMGNKAGKFNVPPTEAVAKDGQVINENEVKVDDANAIEMNGDQPPTESNGVDKTKTEPKKKSIVSWFKKASIRKEKKLKAPKENGVKESNETPIENGVHEEAENNEAPAINGDVISDQPESKETPEVHAGENEVQPEVDGQHERKEDKEDVPAVVVNGHDEGVEEANTTEPQVEEQ